MNTKFEEDNIKLMKNKHKLIIGFSIGDYNGVGPEILIKAFKNNKLFKKCIPIVFCDQKIIKYYEKKLNIHIKSYNPKKIYELKNNVLNIYSKIPYEVSIEPGKSSNDAGKYAFESLKESMRFIKEKKINGLVTLPFSKINIQSKKFNFPGHTEFLMYETNQKEHIMMMVAKKLKLGLISGHIPLSEVTNFISKSKFYDKILLFINSLKNDFKIKNPKIAVLGINPHAGESGLLGKEEIKIINPIINLLNNEGNKLFGPISADAFFGMKDYLKYDGVISLYHDQGLVGFKSLFFDKGVNYTGGLPIIRTSPDHGTAYDIAGKNKASELSLIKAINLNIKILNNRNL
mgnify:FL=1